MRVRLIEAALPNRTLLHLGGWTGWGGRLYGGKGAGGGVGRGSGGSGGGGRGGGDYKLFGENYHWKQSFSFSAKLDVFVCLWCMSDTFLTFIFGLAISFLCLFLSLSPSLSHMKCEVGRYVSEESYNYNWIIQSEKSLATPDCFAPYLVNVRLRNIALYVWKRHLYLKNLAWKF